MRHLLTAAILPLIAACASAGYQGMSPEQIVAIGKIKDASINCVASPTPWGRTIAMFVNVDRGVIPAGTVTADQDCKITITQEKTK